VLPIRSSGSTPRLAREGLTRTRLIAGRVHRIFRVASVGSGPKVAVRGAANCGRLSQQYAMISSALASAPGRRLMATIEDPNAIAAIPAGLTGPREVAGRASPGADFGQVQIGAPLQRATRDSLRRPPTRS
jgi:hypothetical protein